jgi:hypothetical protein
LAKTQPILDYLLPLNHQGEVSKYNTIILTSHTRTLHRCFKNQTDDRTKETYWSLFKGFYYN